MRPVRLLVVLTLFPLLIACLQGAPAGGDTAAAEGVDVAAQVQPEVLTPKGDPEQVLGIKLIGWRFRILPGSSIVDPGVPLDFEIPIEGEFRLPLLVEIAYTRDENDNPIWFSSFRGPRIRVIFVPHGAISPTDYLYTDRTVDGVHRDGYNALFSGLSFGEGNLLVYYNGGYRNIAESENVMRFPNAEAHQHFLSDPFTYYLGSLQLHPKE